MRILDTGVAEAVENMKIDQELLNGLKPSDSPLLHLYRWDGLSATFGHFIEAVKYFHLEKVASNKLKLAKRPTGGGIVFHIWDFAFSFLMPADHPSFSQNTLENYRFVNERVLEAMESLFKLKEQELLTAERSMSEACKNFCMAGPTQYDVVYRGMKIAGAAQRRTKQGFLHQGTISLASPQFPLLKEVLRSEEAVFQAMKSFTFVPLGAHDDLEEARNSLQKVLTEKFMEKLS